MTGSNEQVIERYIAACMRGEYRRGEWARNYTGSIVCCDDTLYSYGDPIARFYENGHDHIFLWQVNAPSKTSAEHINLFVRTAPGYTRNLLGVPGVMNLRPHHNVDWVIRSLSERLEARTTLWRKAVALRVFRKEWERLEHYCKFFGLEEPSPDRLSPLARAMLTFIGFLKSFDDRPGPQFMGVGEYRETFLPALKQLEGDEHLLREASRLYRNRKVIFVNGTSAEFAVFQLNHTGFVRKEGYHAFLKRLVSRYGPEDGARIASRLVELFGLGDIPSGRTSIPVTATVRRRSQPPCVTVRFICPVCGEWKQLVSTEREYEQDLLELKLPVTCTFNRHDIKLNIENMQREQMEELLLEAKVLNV